VFFYLKMRVAIGLIRTHGTAQNDEPMVTSYVWANFGETGKIHVANTKSGRLKLTIQCTQRLERDMLEYQ